MSSLINLWNGESGWNQFAKNASSGAYGIPQSLPANKMASSGPDWLVNPATQINWGLNYIKSVYGTPSNAYSMWLSRSPHWYGSGAWQVSSDQIAGIHKDEMVLPPRMADAVRDAVSGGGSAPVQQFTIYTNEIDPRIHAAQLGWELSTKTS
jgi:hypothetical protein